MSGVGLFFLLCGGRVPEGHLFLVKVIIALQEFLAF